MLKQNLLAHRSVGKWIVPVYFSAADFSWIDQLNQMYERHVGKTRRDLRLSLCQVSLTEGCRRKQKILETLLDKIYFGKTRLNKPSPRSIRREVFYLAARAPVPTTAGDREKLISNAADRLKLTSNQVELNLFGDLIDEKVLSSADSPVDLETLVLKANLALVQSYLARSEKVRIHIFGNARPVIRHAKWRGLICCVYEHPPAREGVRVEISGPLSIVRKTLIYGRVLSELVPYLGTMNKFILEAKIPYTNNCFNVLRVQSGDPIFPKLGLKKYDSQLEQKFAAKFLRATDDWDLVREPGPFRAGGEFIYPDFAIKHRTASSPLWYLEIVGFWTEEYLRNKLAKYRLAKLERLILCLREPLQCGAGDLPVNARIVRFKSAIAPEDVLAILDR